jgi:hypothetical protein
MNSGEKKVAPSTPEAMAVVAKRMEIGKTYQYSKVMKRFPWECCDIDVACYIWRFCVQGEILHLSDRLAKGKILQINKLI